MQQVHLLLMLFALTIIAAVFYLEGAKSSTVALCRKTVVESQGAPEYTTHSEGIRSAWVRDYYTKQSYQRVSRLNSMGNVKDFTILYNVIVPEVQCPNLVRVGTVLDGGKFVCNPLSIPKGKCRVYSLGLSNQITFDQEIYEITGKRCAIHGYDVRVPVARVRAAYETMNGTLEAKFISRRKGSRIEDIFDNNGDIFADILKIDIEGSEHSTLIPFLSNGRYSVCQRTMSRGAQFEAAEFESILLEA